MSNTNLIKNYAEKRFAFFIKPCALYYKEQRAAYDQSWLLNFSVNIRVQICLYSDVCCVDALLDFLAVHSGAEITIAFFSSIRLDK